MRIHSFRRMSLALLLASSVAFGHGEDEDGPHGGMILMPGAFHTELVPLDSKSVDIFLLDLNFKNPTTRSSTLEAMAVRGAQELRWDCQPRDDRFTCRAPVDEELKPGDILVVQASRDKAVATAAQYAYPFSRKSNRVGKLRQPQQEQPPAQLQDYLKVQEALASDSLTEAKSAARSLQGSLSSVALPKKSEAIEAAGVIAKSTSLEQARKAFKKLSASYVEQYENASQPAARVVYCPMAGAKWVQREGEIRNPYYGKEMLNCGVEVSKR